MMKTILAIATAFLMFADVQAAEDGQLLSVWSQEYTLQSNPGIDDQWTDVGLRFCVMKEVIKGEDADMPTIFDQKKSEAPIGLDLTDSKTRLFPEEATLLSMPCWERKDIKNQKKTCDGWHVDESANGEYRVHLCN